MYSGSSLKPLRSFDAWFGAHQKIDRIAARHLKYLLGAQATIFPTVKSMMQFEGFDGPDGIKIKTPAQGEPWHYYNPYDKEDTQIIELLKKNFAELVTALKKDDKIRAGFEAAWLAHGLVDGLTPAHHYPYEEELVRLRGGAGKETRTSKREKVLMPGETIREKVSNNWGMWGEKGLLSTHVAFEIGVAVLIVPMRLTNRLPNAAELQLARTKDGYIKLFQKAAVEIAELKLYERFYQSGWTPKVARLVRSELVPKIVDVVTLAWYAAVHEASKKR